MKYARNLSEVKLDFWSMKSWSTRTKTLASPLFAKNVLQSLAVFTNLRNIMPLIVLTKHWKKRKMNLAFNVIFVWSLFYWSQLSSNTKNVHTNLKKTILFATFVPFPSAQSILIGPINWKNIKFYSNVMNVRRILKSSPL